MQGVAEVWLILLCWGVLGAVWGGGAQGRRLWGSVLGAVLVVLVLVLVLVLVVGPGATLHRAASRNICRCHLSPFSTYNPYQCTA